MEFGETLSRMAGGGIAGALVALAIVLGPKALDWLRSRSRDEAEVAKTREREATARHRIEADGTALAAEVVRERAEELRAKAAEHEAERTGHRACLARVAELEGRVAGETSARHALERVVFWALEKLGIDEKHLPEDVAQTLERIRPTITPEPAE